MMQNHYCKSKNKPDSHKLPGFILPKSVIRKNAREASHDWKSQASFHGLTHSKNMSEIFISGIKSYILKSRTKKHER